MCLEFPKPTHISIEEVDELKATTLRLEKENEGLRWNLDLVTHERNRIKWDLNQEGKRIKVSMEMFKVKRGETKQMIAGLLSVIFNLDSLNQQLEAAWKERHSLNSLWEQTLRERKI